MIRFQSIIECVVEHTPACRVNGLDRNERNVRGLLGLGDNGLLYRYNYVTKRWKLQEVLLDE